MFHRSLALLSHASCACLALACSSQDQAKSGDENTGASAGSGAAGSGAASNGAGSGAASSSTGGGGSGSSAADNSAGGGSADGGSGSNGDSAGGDSAGGDGAGGDSAGAGGAPNTGGNSGSTGGATPTGGSSSIEDADWVLDASLPIATDKPSLTSINHALSPTELWGSDLSAPLPTNEFWMNFVLNAGEQRINALPYHIRAQEAGLSVARPDLEVSSAGIVTAGYTQLLLTAEESTSQHQVVAFDDLSVTVEWTAGSGSFRAPVVYGMPYASAHYDGATPRVETPGAAILSLNGSDVSPVTAKVLEVELNSGQIWRIYSEEELSWDWNANELVADSPTTAWIRGALVTEAAMAMVLDAHADVVPTGGDVGLSIAGDNGQVDFNWKQEGEGDLLMMALPHHSDRLVEATSVEITYKTLRGTLQGVAGDHWTLSYPLSRITWDAPIAPLEGMRADIVSALEKDASFQVGAPDPYGAGKEMSRLARYALIASELGEASLVETFLSSLRPVLSDWLDGENDVNLAYDTTWGGIVTERGVSDSAVDFGQGYYNDHHFHYGYHIYAAAVLAREDAAWAAEYSQKVLWLIRDIANPSSADPYFPRYRAMDWFVGHSWASGLFEFGDGRNQESTSEAVHAWYGVELFGKAIGDDNVACLGRMLRAAEVASAQKYWQVSDDSIYPAPFSDNKGMGIVWSTKVDFSTFFGANPEYIYGIQMIPFTPASEDFLDPLWIEAAWPKLSAAAAGAVDNWAGFLYMSHAQIDPDAATSEMSEISSYDNGNSEANALHWLATRPR